MKVLLVCIFFSVNVLYAYAQKWKDIQAKDKIFRVNISDITPTPDGSISLGAEYLLKKNISVSMDVGYVFYAIPNTDVKAKNTGIFVRPGLRYYPKRKFFLEIDAEVFLKGITTTVTDWLGINCVNEVPSYYNFKTFRYYKNSPTINLKIGTQKLLHKKFNCWLEPYVGIGIRFQNTYFINEENSCYLIGTNTNQLVVINSKKEIVPTIPAGIRILLKL